MADVEIRHVKGDRFLVRVRDHTLLVDQPRRDGGDDAGPTPTELFVVSIGTCAAFYAERFLLRHGIPIAGFKVLCDYRMSEDRPARVASVDLHLDLPTEFPRSRIPALRAVVEHCTVENSLRQAPSVCIELETRGAAA